MFVLFHFYCIWFSSHTADFKTSGEVKVNLSANIIKCNNQFLLNHLINVKFSVHLLSNQLVFSIQHLYQASYAEIQSGQILHVEYFWLKEQQFPGVFLHENIIRSHYSYGQNDTTYIELKKKTFCNPIYLTYLLWGKTHIYMILPQSFKHMHAP